MKLAQRAYRLATHFLAAAPFLLSGLVAPAAGWGQPALDIDLSGSVDAVLAPASADTLRGGPYGEARLDISAEHVRDDGIRIGFALGLAARADSGRRGQSRPFGDCPPGISGCASVAGLAPVGLFSGLHAAAGPYSAGPRAGVEVAQLVIRAPLWEAWLGYGPGAAAAEATTLPGALRLMRADGPLVDPSGRAVVSTANTLSGHAPKLLVRTRRLAGFRLAASFTPDGDTCGVAVCRLDPGTPGLAIASVSDIAEAAASFEHRFAATGVRWKAFLSAARGDAGGALAGSFRDPWAVSGGVQREQGAITLGASALVSNDGFAGARYQAAAASMSYERGDWLFSAEIGEARSTLVHARSRSALLAASRYFDTGVILGFGLSHTDADIAVPEAMARGRRHRSGTQAFAEAGLRF
jgi:hypothetical protein